jgi:hypothetical protein
LVSVPVADEATIRSRYSRSRLQKPICLGKVDIDSFGETNESPSDVHVLVLIATASSVAPTSPISLCERL